MSLFILDAHQDIAYNALTFNRDYRRSALVTRRLEQQAAAAYPSPTLGLPEAIVGRVAVVFSTLFVAPEGSWATSWPEETYKNQRQAHDLAMKQFDYYSRLADESKHVTLVRSLADLDGALATWETGKPITDRQQALIVLMEGADPILEPRQFEEWYARGVRIVGPAWSTTRYAAGNGKEGTLTKDGYELLDVMASFDAILDLSHLSEKASLAALDYYTGTIIASHSNPRKFCDSDRHLTDTQIRRLSERDGVMGIVLYNRFLSPKWTKGDAKSTLTLDVVADAIDHVCQITGSAAHVGIGSDYDGGFGSESIPYELDTVGDTMLIAGKLEARGYSPEQIEGIMGGNMLRKIRAVLK